MPDACCPRHQCRLTDDLLVKTYNIVACIGRIGNSFSQLILGLSQILQESGADFSAQTLSDASHSLWQSCHTWMIVSQLSFTFSYYKSSLTPSQKVGWLGMTLDSQSMRAFLSQKRVGAILQLVGCFWKCRLVRYRLLLKLLGAYYNSSIHGHPPGSPFLMLPSNLGQHPPFGSQVEQGQKSQGIRPLLSGLDRGFTLQ